jgi:hypothetical protein
VYISLLSQPEYVSEASKYINSWIEINEALETKRPATNCGPRAFDIDTQYLPYRSILIRCVKYTPHADMPSEHARSTTKDKVESAWRKWRSRSMDDRRDKVSRGIIAGTQGRAGQDQVNH